jgi:uncharacterized membrane protein
VLELTAMRFFWQFNIDYKILMLTVLWALGWAMIVLGVLVFLPAWAVGAVGAVMIATHNVFDRVQATSLGALAPLWTILHVPGVAFAGPPMVFVSYPLVPWIGVTAVGYALGQVFTWEAERRRAMLVRLGIGCVVAFLALRAMNVYGDPQRWEAQRSTTFTLLSFINANKYPPSLLYLLMTLGPALLLLRAVDAKTPSVLRPALVIGKVPFFYFVMHVLLLHLAAVLASYVRYGTVHFMFESPTLDRFPVTQPPGWPAPLLVVYLIWAGVVVTLYPLCRWYAAFRARRTDAWLSYL